MNRCVNNIPTYHLNLQTCTARCTASSIAQWNSAGFEYGRSRVQSPVKDRVIPVIKMVPVVPLLV